MWWYPPVSPNKARSMKILKNIWNPCLFQETFDVLDPETGNWRSNLSSSPCPFIIFSTYYRGFTVRIFFGCTKVSCFAVNWWVGIRKKRIHERDQAPWWIQRYPNGMKQQLQQLDDTIQQLGEIIWQLRIAGSKVMPRAIGDGIFPETVQRGRQTSTKMHWKKRGRFQDVQCSSAWGKW